MKPGAVVEEADGTTHKCVCDGSSCLVVVEGTSSSRVCNGERGGGVPAIIAS